VYIFEQALDSSNFPIAGSAFTFKQALYFDNNHLGRSVDYDWRSNILAACTDLTCKLFSKMGANWVPTGQPNLGGTGSHVFQDGIVPGIGYAIVGAGTSATFYDLASGTYSNSVTVSPGSNLLFGGFTGGADRALIGVTSTTSAGGHLFEYAKSPYGPSAQWSRTHDITSTTGSGGFGTTVAFSGNYALVSDPSVSNSSVHRYFLDTNGSTTVADDVWSEISSLGTASATYGASIALYLQTAALGEPSTDHVYIWPIDNVTSDTTTTVPGITIQTTQIGTIGSTQAQLDPTCTSFGTRFVITPSNTCVEVTTTAELFGLSTVCFSNFATGNVVYRCHKRAACVQGEVPNGQDSQGAFDCCTSLNQVAGPPGQYCVQTDTFSSIGYATAVDTDGDQRPDIIDNCPTVPNILQQDSDLDGVGDACDNCPNTPNQDQKDSNHNGVGDACEAVVQTVPVPPPASGVLGLTLGVLGIWLSGAAAARKRQRTNHALSIG
jgi:hypothetical protein